jgi:Yip1-like protein
MFVVVLPILRPYTLRTKNEPEPHMGLVQRVKNILLTPKTEWDVIAAENTPPKELLLTYVLPLAAVAAVAGFISQAIIGTTLPLVGGTYRMPIVWALVMLIYQLLMSVISVFVVGFIIDALAPSFGGQKNFNQALKVTAYCYTAGWVGAIFGIIPFIGWLIGLLFALYGIYLLYLGLPRLMKNPQDKSVVYTIVVIVVAILVAIVIGFIGTMITAPAMIAAHGYGGGIVPSVTYDRKSPMGKMDEFARKMEEAGKKMEAAEKSGDSKKQMEAAMGVLGTAISGGKGVEPVQLDVLKPYLPEKFAGLPRTDLRTERSGVSGFMTAKAEGIYSDASGKNIELDVIDTGGAAGLVGLASWMGVQGEKENAQRRESTRKEGNRLVHEEVSKQGGSNKYTVILGDRFVVTAQGSADIGTLKSGVNSLDLGKLESTK